MSSVSVKAIVPHEFKMPQPASTSAHITRKRQVEILPSENSTFSYATNDRIVINISSQTEFLKAMDSYIRGNITATLTNDGANVTTKALDEGGVMSVFRTVELRSQSGVLIERWERANRLYAMISNATQPRYFVESSMGTQLDSVGFSADEVDQFSSSGGATTYRAARNEINGAGVKREFAMKLPLGFLNMVQDIPLMLIKQGLQLVLEMDRPQLAMNSHVIEGAGAGFANCDIVLSEIRYVASMITPDESVVQNYLTKFNSEGMHYIFSTWRHRRKTIDYTENSGASLSYQFGVRSARSVFSVIQSALLSDTASDNAIFYDSISTFLSTGVRQYQYRSGAEEYPNHEIVLYDGVQTNAYSEAFDQLMLSVNQFASKLHQTRFLPYQWKSVNTLSIQDAANSPQAVANESTKLIMAADLSRDNSPWTGLDLSINNLDLELDFYAAGNQYLGNRVVHTWVNYDSLFSLSQQNGMVIRK